MSAFGRWFQPDIGCISVARVRDPERPPHLNPAADYATAATARSGGGVNELASARSFVTMLAQKEGDPVNAGQQEK